jgi:hypothetical protein
MGFVVDKVTLKQVLLRGLRFSRHHCTNSLHSILFICHQRCVNIAVDTVNKYNTSQQETSEAKADFLRIGVRTRDLLIYFSY